MNVRPLARRLAVVLRPVIVAAVREGLAGAHAPAEQPAALPKRRRGSGRPSRIERDAEVRAAIEEAFFKYRTLDETLSMLHARFRAERAPSRSSLGRYFKWLGRSGRGA